MREIPRAVVCFLMGFCYCQVDSAAGDPVMADDRGAGVAATHSECLDLLVGVRELVYKGRDEAALQLCDTILKKDPHNREARWIRSRIYDRLGRGQESEGDLDYIIKNYPDYALGYLERARRLLRVPPRADGGHRFMTWLHSPDVRMRQGAIDAVRLYAHQLLQAKLEGKGPTLGTTENEERMRARARVAELAEKGLLAEGFGKCTLLLQEDPENVLARWERALISQRLAQDMLRRCEQDLDRILALQPDFQPAYMPRALQLLSLEAANRGPESFLKWLHSSDTRKRRAALEALHRVALWQADQGGPEDPQVAPAPTTVPADKEAIR